MKTLNSKSGFLRHQIAGLIALLFISSTAVGQSVFRGMVTNPAGEPIFGASVAVMVDNGFLKGTGTRPDGSFLLSLHIPDGIKSTLRVTSVGYEPNLIPLDSMNSTSEIQVSLVPKETKLAPITVASTNQLENSGSIINRRRVQQEARQSLMTTNPLSSLKEPQLTRRGSSQSSTLRINGTSPQYFINGISMGSDPNHYGLFSILPISVVDNISFYPQGTSAKYGSPSVVELATPARFGKGATADAYLSMLEGTGSYSYGDSRFFALGSIRQSIVDLLDDRFGATENGTRFPATHFRDLFGSGGYQLGTAHRLFIDAYDVRDNMQYERPPEGTSRGIASYISTRQNYVGLRDQVTLNGNLALRSGLAYAARDEFYVVGGWRGEPSVIRGKLNEKTELLNSHLAADLIHTDRKLTVGFESELILARSTDLTQRNWNFLPPDATTDNPFIYTPELNELYGEYSDEASALNSAVYFSMTQQFGRLTVESGVRRHYFGELKQKSAVALRQRFSVEFGHRTCAELFLGTFAENPINRVLEPYQVLVRANASGLEPIGTYLTSLSLSHGGLRVSGFMKEINRYPTLAPDFSKIDPVTGTPEHGFLAMRPSGSLEFTGFDLSYDAAGLLRGKLDIYSYYGYTHSLKRARSVEVPYDLSAPHRFLLETNWHATRSLTIGGTFQIRSGYPHSPDHSDYISLATGADERYTESYYRDYLKEENSEQFPVNASLNLHCSLEMGKTTVYGNVTNVTNRSNPVIFTGQHYIYDLGIFPSIGISTSF